MSGHTPGPWVADGGETCGIRDSEAGRLALCTFLRGPHGMGGRRDANEVAANARLIAAAPELLEALRGVLDCGSPIYTPAYEAAKAALYKATGEGA